MSKTKKDTEKNPSSKYVTLEQCSGTTSQFREEIHTLKLALFGEDMCGGIVKDLHDIKSQTSLVKSILLPIIIAVASSLITAYALGNFP